MPFTQLIVLAVLQAVTEIFPIGATGHIALISQILDWQDPGEGFRILVRAGLLLAVLAYFWSDLFDMIAGVARAAKGKRDPGARLALQLAIAAIPILGLGFAFEHYVAGAWETPHVMGWMLAGGALLLLFFDRMSMTVKRIEHATFVDAFAVGLGQVVGLIPGAGAAAFSIIFARLLGYERADAARFSFLLFVPVAATVIGRDTYMFVEAGQGQFLRSDVVGGGISFFAGIFALAIMMAWLRRSSFTPFVVYRLLLGIAVLGLAYAFVDL